MNNEEKYDYWFDAAQYDLGSAGDSFKAGRWLYFAFMCHQAIEKIIKGLYILYNDDYNIPKIHNLDILINKFETKLKEPIPEEINTVFIALSGYYIVARYPDYKRKMSQTLNKVEVTRILTKTKEVFAWLLTLKP